MNLIKSRVSIILKTLSIGAGLGIWHLIVHYQIIRTTVIPSPTGVIASFIVVLKKEEIAYDILISVSRVVLGFLIGSVIALILAVFTAYFKLLKNVTGIWIEFFRPIPPIAWIPLAILWFGLGNKPAIFLVALGSFFPVYSSAYGGFISLPKKYVDTAKTLGANFRLILVDVIIPAVLPSIMSGLRIGLGVSWMIVITAELVGATSGLGYFIQLNRILLNIDKVVVGMILIGTIGLVMNNFLGVVEGCFIKWKCQEEVLCGK